MEFKQLIVERYASREYTGRKVEDEKIGQLIEMIRSTPSTFNLQPWKIKVIADGKLKEQLASFAFGGHTQIITCSHLLVLCANTEWDGLIIRNDISYCACSRTFVVIPLAKIISSSIVSYPKIRL